ncbi:MAG: DNA-processing protein DprA [Planctomycetes bacterium]|nr:DNA-processing protein DprA [Planctomycetota bacterium]
MRDETVIWLALSHVSGLGRRTLESLLARFGGPEAILQASETDLVSTERVTRDMARAIRGADVGAAGRELEELAGSGIEIRHWRGPGYPGNLSLAADRPALLQVRGGLADSDVLSVAVVGSTRPSASGQRAARRLARELADRGLTVVSGLARGIDAAAHQGALEAGGRTLAVLGCGLMRVYPSAHRGLARQVAEHGAVISELEARARVTSQHLMARNRITSGLARATVVVESEEDSGSVQTAAFARRQGRWVFAVESGPAGNRAVLAQGAIPLGANPSTDADEVAERVRIFTLLERPGGLRQLDLEFPP